MYPVEGAVIACAGLGSRLGMGLPKCMIEVGGRTLLSRLIDQLRPHVPRVHVVVGYREELITDYCALHHRDVVLVRNTDFRSTNTAHSLMLGSVGFSRKVLFLDGDLIIESASLDRFLERAALVDHLLGVTRAKSSEAVFVSTKLGPHNESLEVQRFHREPPSPFEWANLFSTSPALLMEGDRYVYECLERHLPMSAEEVNLYEIDTPDDLSRANAGVYSFEPTN
jgi:choline kinase